MTRPRLTKYGNCKSGYFDVSESRKYVYPDGILEPPAYKSSYEWSFMRFSEGSSKVVSWTCEPFSIPYFDVGTNKNRNYWIDFIIKTTNNETLWIEVKDSKELKAVNDFKKRYMEIKNPEIRMAFAHKNKKVAMNFAKWETARQVAKQNGVKFIVVTEIDLKGF